MPYTAALLLCLVVHVSDGDSLFARCHEPGASAFWPVKVRIADIDAPELAQRFGRASRANLEALCLGKEAEIATVTRDPYERLVAHVRCGGVDAAGAQVQSGLAWLYTWRRRSIPTLQALQDRAQARHLGLWSEASPQAPWNYRRQHPPYGHE
ncbi:thermonuclease family protein [Diaphorobacter caeni]|uniref:thermonuclease family protein n=1 Tax=Diaphorobacter caeni TaxID=2784387 RepID=UPI00188DE127|nr:thermonuclease family protein [Diaphorobacter caeni]MBF5006246.1 thermonuclease family protein [Diaphorobacter caeni]